MQSHPIYQTRNLTSLILHSNLSGGFNRTAGADLQSARLTAPDAVTGNLTPAHLLSSAAPVGSGQLLGFAGGVRRYCIGLPSRHLWVRIPSPAPVSPPPPQAPDFAIQNSLVAFLFEVHVTVIAWDGKTLAADKMMGFGSSKSSVTKIFKIGGALVGFAGHSANGQELLEWFRSSRRPSDFPASQRGVDSVTLLVIESDGKILHYGQSPHPMIIEDAFHAIGSGDEFALAAMYLGRTARDAVEVACALCPTCGNGIDTLSFVD